MEQTQTELIIAALKEHENSIKEDIKVLVNERLSSFEKVILARIDERLDILRREMELNTREITLLSQQVDGHDRKLRRHDDEIDEIKRSNQETFEKPLNKLFKRIIIAASLFVLLNLGIISALVYYATHKN